MTRLLAPLLLALLPACAAEAEAGRPPSDAEVAAKMGLPLDEFEKLKSEANAVNLVSLNKKWYETDSYKDVREVDILEDAKGEGTIFHVIGIIALVFFLIDLIVWMLALTRIRKVEQQVDQFKHEPDTPRMTGEK